MFKYTLILLFMPISWGADINNVCHTYDDYQFHLQDNCWFDPDVNDVIDNIGPRYGRKVIELQTTTRDGYVLMISKLTNNKKLVKNDRYPILMIHGMGKGRENWVLNGADSFAIRYSKENTVYVVGIRGSRGSQGHVNLTVNDGRYWDFSYDEQRFDIEATVQTILADSKKDKVIIICHSQGCANYATFASLHSEYANKHIAHAILLAPAILISPVKVIAINFLSLFSDAISIIGPFIGNGQISIRLLDYCQNYYLMRICETFVTSIFGKSNYINYPEFMRVVTSPVNNNDYVVRVMQHFLQNINHRCFDRPDLGPIKNMIKYNQTTPPKYPLNDIKHKVTIISFSDDLLTPPDNSLLVYNQLQTDKKIYVLPEDLSCSGAMGHCDTIFNNETVPCLQKLTDTIIESIYIT